MIFEAHYSAQYSGGAHGSLVICGPMHQEFDIDVGPITLEDWFHADYYSLVKEPWPEVSLLRTTISSTDG